jgi:hypothetical protein
VSSETLATPEHPNIARLLDGGTSDDGRPYFVMEWVDVVPITDYCERASLDLRGRVWLLMRVCDEARNQVFTAPFGCVLESRSDTPGT